MFNYPETKKIYEITAIVPAYNEEDTVEDTIKSILNVDYPGLKEIIVVDDGSTDNTWKIIQGLAKKYEKVKAYTKENEGSKACPLNFGLKKVKTEIVAVIDADSYPAVDSFRKMVVASFEYGTDRLCQTDTCL